ncbi:MAG TPA: alpha-xylosidase [Spirochaeta sp.]|nr:alpha-xylosidase [Spirochaeta sp.]
MKHSTDFMEAMADFDQYPDAVIWRAGSPLSAELSGSSVKFGIPFNAFRLQGGLIPVENQQSEIHNIYLTMYTGNIIRLCTTPEYPDSPMLSLSEDLRPVAIEVKENNDSFEITDCEGNTAAVFYKYRSPEKGWSTLIRESFDSLSAIFFSNSSAVSFSSYDQFFPEKVESLPLAYIDYEASGVRKRSTLFSFHAANNEHFVGTGERFARMDLAGGTYSLENTDGLGNNSRRTYKNVPFFLSSRGYGLFIHSSAHIRLSLADISTRAVQARVEDAAIDLFIIGGGKPETILYNYRRLTGFPPQLPLWSYGMWMSRMTYFSADEIDNITDRMRSEKYPCDLIHIDTGWFEKDWVCEWKFSNERFPDPKGFLSRLKKQGFRVSLWQTPNIGGGNCLLEEAKEKRYLAPPRNAGVASESDFSGQDFGGQIDFTNSEAVDWYKKKIRNLFELGAAVIKTDFGEKIQMDADYLNMPADKLHNLYGLLYQRAVFEETSDSTGEAIIWARAGWAGCQRYPLHWGGDTAATWDGMAAVLRGGLHLGLSGYGYWSHDVPGFHSLPEFMNTMPAGNLYIRWTQFGVFSSHFRYHGTSPREPWYYPSIAPLIKKWLNLRYMLIPYLAVSADNVSNSGMPVLRAMLLHHPEDPTCWNIDDQYYIGDSILVCPVMNDEGKRNVYLPEGCWRDFWTGSKIKGGCWLMNIESAIERLPVYITEGANIPVYPEPVQCTDEMDEKKIVTLKSDQSFSGISSYYSDPNLLP